MTAADSNNYFVVIAVKGGSGSITMNYSTIQID